jgi:hypothetical protein
MRFEGCPPPEALLDEAGPGPGEVLEHAKGCESCAAVIEEHRQLEKDLARLVDPLPPPDFLRQVMERVASAPTPARSEIWGGAAIVTLALALSAITFFAGGGELGGVAAWTAAVLIHLHEWVIALSSGLSAVWSTTGAALATCLGALLFLSLLGLHRLAKVSPEKGVSA